MGPRLRGDSQFETAKSRWYSFAGTSFAGMSRNEWVRGLGEMIIALLAEGTLHNHA